MGDGAKRVARLGLLTALSVVLVLLTELVPAGRLGLLTAASFPVCMALMMYGPGWAAAVFAAAAVLGFALFPGAAVRGFALFFGYWPIAKSVIERVPGRWQPWALKVLLYTAVFTAAWFLIRTALSGPSVELPWFALYLPGAAAFFVGDWCYSLVIRFYLDKIARYFT